MYNIIHIIYKCVYAIINLTDDIQIAHHVTWKKKSMYLYPFIACILITLKDTDMEYCEASMNFLRE